MTKPVQINRYCYVPRYVTYEGEFGGCMERLDDGEYVTYADHQAALLQVREKLIELAEKLRKDSWTGEGSEQYRMGRGHSANELEALAATLGNQGK